MSQIKEKFRLSFIKESFKKAWAGKEEIKNIYLWWGIVAYVFCFLILRPLINASFFRYTEYSIIDKFIEIPLSIIIVVYFILHIYFIYKNTPRTPKLTAEEKKAQKEQQRKDLGKKIVRKLLLKESIGKWRPWLVFGALDLIIITTYADYIF